MSWTFIQKKDGSWWLKVSTIEEYARYRDETDSKRYGDILKDMLAVAEGKHERNPATTAILLENEKHRGRKSALELVADFSSRVAEWQLGYLMKGYYLLFNRCGGCHFDTDRSYRWIHKSDLVFPEFTEKDIKIERFPDGQHYYAYVGSSQVRDGDVLKWDTYDEAYRHAKEYIKD